MTDSKIYLDTAPFIYYLEENALYFEQIRAFFKKCYENRVALFTSALTVEEYCVYPLSLGNEKAVENFNSFISGMNIAVISADKGVALAAAEIRAKYKGFKALDAIHLATAKASECDFFITNDKQLRQMKEIKIFQK